MKRGHASQKGKINNTTAAKRRRHQRHIAQTRLEKPFFFLFLFPFSPFLHLSNPTARDIPHYFSALRY